MLSQLDDVVAEFDDRGNKRRRHDQPRHDHQAMRSADPRAQYRPGPGPSDAFVALQEVSALICTPLSCHALAAHSPRPPRRWGFGLYLGLYLGLSSAARSNVRSVRSPPTRSSRTLAPSQYIIYTLAKFRRGRDELVFRWPHTISL